MVKLLLSKKPIFFIIGFLNVFLFHFAIYRLWHLLFNLGQRNISNSFVEAFFVDLALLIFFSAPHSLFLDSKVKRVLLNYIPKGLYYSFYSIHACLAILMIDRFWINFGPQDLFDFGDTFYRLMIAMNIFSWIFLFAAQFSTGLFHQSGIEDWWRSLRGKKLIFKVYSEGLYKYCRHPIYAGFVLVIWCTPHMTLDHVFLSLFWSIYVAIGASLKERRLQRNKGYQEYSERVTSFPLIPKSVDNYLIKNIWRVT
jgi:protein-S-isoprenylcysteine O-methyltransferase Ste14